MTELETLQRAKMYMEKLANGINPIDGSMIPDEEVINNVRLSRCFFYVADVLGQVIENGGVKPQKKVRDRPFAITMDERARFAFSETPIPVSEIAKRINALTAEDMKNLSYNAIRDWLLSLGMLEEVQNSQGKKEKRPTPRGETMGIRMEERIGRDGPYLSVQYNLAAQQFILDNLDAVIALCNANKEKEQK